MKNTDSLPTVLTEDLIEFIANSHDGLNETPWSEICFSLTAGQMKQVFDFLDARNKIKQDNIPLAERDEMHRYGAVHWVRDGRYVDLWQEYIMSNDMKWYEIYAEEQKKRFIHIDFYGFFIKQFNNIYMTEKEVFTFFHRRNSEFSMFYPCQIVVENMTFNSASQYMAYAKAEEFRDRQLMAKIMEVKDISKYRELSQQVEYFYRPVYAMMVGRWLRTVLEAKFTQNPDLQAALFATKGTTIALATNENKRWDIGLKQDDPLAQKRATWQGQNILGELLTELRVKLMEEY